jgi:hypothetical protein
VAAPKEIVTSLLFLLIDAEDGALGGGKGVCTGLESRDVGLSPPAFLDQTLKVYVDPRVKEEYVRSLLVVVSTSEYPPPFTLLCTL